MKMPALTTRMFAIKAVPAAFLAASLMFGAATANASGFQSYNTFVDAKSGFVVHVSTQGNDMLLTGHNPTNGETFELTVSRKGEVNGMWRGETINYVLPAAALSELRRYN